MIIEYFFSPEYHLYLNDKLSMQAQEENLSGIYTKGCVSAIRVFVEDNVFMVGGVLLGLAISQLTVIWLGKTLEGQIKHQKALWIYENSVDLYK